MKKDKQQLVLEFIEKITSPQITKGEIEKKAGLPQGHLSNGYKMRPATLDKITKVLKPFGFKP